MPAARRNKCLQIIWRIEERGKKPKRQPFFSESSGLAFIFTFSRSKWKLRNDCRNAWALLPASLHVSPPRLQPSALPLTACSGAAPGLAGITCARAIIELQSAPDGYVATGSPTTTDRDTSPPLTATRPAAPCALCQSEMDILHPKVTLCPQSQITTAMRQQKRPKRQWETYGVRKGRASAQPLLLPALPHTQFIESMNHWDGKRPLRSSGPTINPALPCLQLNQSKAPRLHASPVPPEVVTQLLPWANCSSVSLPFL